MSWRDRIKAGAENINSNHRSNKSNNSNIQEKHPINSNIANIANIAPKIKIEKAIIPPPQPKGLGLVYDDLWQKAWQLANQIDDYRSGIPVEQRRAMLPELNQMRAELSRMESLGVEAPGKAIESVKQVKHIEIQEANPDSCPARCKRTGKCYGRAYFDGKSGKAQECTAPCQWTDKT